ncbi:hypothetical protein Plhal703r1_c05g0027011 [Plasmopara halstedii]
MFCCHSPARGDELFAAKCHRWRSDCTKYNIDFLNIEANISGYVYFFFRHVPQSRLSAITHAAIRKSHQMTLLNLRQEMTAGSVDGDSDIKSSMQYQTEDGRKTLEAKKLYTSNCLCTRKNFTLIAPIFLESVTLASPLSAHTLRPAAFAGCNASFKWCTYVFLVTWTLVSFKDEVRVARCRPKQFFQLPFTVLLNMLTKNACISDKGIDKIYILNSSKIYRIAQHRYQYCVEAARMIV